MKHEPYIQRLLLCSLLSLFFAQCSETSKPVDAMPSVQAKKADQAIPIIQSEQKPKTEHIRILDEIPSHIQEVENLTIFPGDSEPLYSMKLIPVQSYGRTGEPYLTLVIDCIVDDEGRIIIHTSGPPRYEQILHVFNVDGSYHTQLGRHGRGPGEYRHILGLQAKAGKIFVLDYNNQRVNEYSTDDYSFVRSILLETWKSTDAKQFGYIEARNDGNYLLAFIDDDSKTGTIETKRVVMDHEGNTMNVDPLVFPVSFKIDIGQSTQPTQPTMSTISFLGKTITALSREDALYTVFTRDFLIRKYDAAGKYQSAVYYPIEGTPFDLNEYSNSQPFSPKARDIKKAFANMDEEFPETFPIIDKLMVDDENRLWVAVSAGAQREYYEWWILHESGELLAKLVLPKTYRIYDIKNGHLYSKEINEETDTEYVVKYRIEFSDKYPTPFPTKNASE